MKIYTIGMDSIITNQLKQHGFEVIPNVQPPKPEIVQDSIICITSDEIALSDLKAFRETYCVAKIIYKLNEGSLKSIHQTAMICKLHEIDFLAPNATVETLVNIIKPKTEISTNNIVAFFGSKPGIGTTTIAAQYAAEAAKTGANVLLLGLNLYDPGTHSSKFSLTDLKPKLNGLLQQEDIDKIAKMDNYFYLVGNSDPLLVDDYAPHEIEYLIDFLKPHFDFIVADCGAIPNSAAWYVAMQKIPVRYMVTTEKTINRTKMIFDLVEHLDLHPEDFSIIINDSLEDYTAQNYAQRLSSPVVLQINRQKQELLMSKKISEEVRKQISAFIDVKSDRKGAFLFGNRKTV